MAAGIALFAFFLYYVALTHSYRLDETKLKHIENAYCFYDIDGNKMADVSGRENVVSLSEIKEDTKNAFIAIEDKRFYRHNGIDYRGLERALWNNIKSFSMKEGASTISQQLIKNTHLSGEKTLKRKMIEWKLTRALEKEYSKDEILEMYLNTIYFGSNAYGIAQASEVYFGKAPSELTLEESAALAGLIKAPSAYSPLSHPDKCSERKNVVLNCMKEQGFISEEDYQAARSASLNLKEKSAFYSYFDLAAEELEEIFANHLFLLSKAKIYTYYSEETQSALEGELKENTVSPDAKGIILDNKTRGVSAVYMTGGDFRRLPGSAIKPLLVYAPAIEENKICPLTPILDEETDFGGYRPHNYKDAYNGYQSVTECLEKSSNVGAVKILNYVGIDRAAAYLHRLEIEVPQSDRSLALALGAMSEGVTLRELAGGYSALANGGEYLRPSLIRRVEDGDGNTIYRHGEIGERVFSEETAYLTGKMLMSVVKNGTAKKMSFNDYPICGKTGTVGGEDGNTDAYAISYTKEFTVGIWLGNRDNAKMPNDVTGGGLPARYSAELWNFLYREKSPAAFEIPAGISEIKLDRISYETSHTLVLADAIAPEQYVIPCEIKGGFTIKEQSDRFSSPTCENIDFEYNNGVFTIQLCQTELYSFKIYRNGELLLDTKKETGSVFTDSELAPDTEYAYSVVPYYFDGTTEHLGEEILLTKIKTPKHSASAPDHWWEDD